MIGAIILDTETTGFYEPEVIELAFTNVLNHPLQIPQTVTVRRYKASKPIQLGAMSTHHIMDEDLIDQMPWPGFWGGCEFDNAAYLIGHNVDFDWKVIGSPNVKRICTLAFSRWLWPDLDSHTLGAMLYFHNRVHARELLKNAHSADTDVHVCGQLFNAIIHKLLDLGYVIDTFDAVWHICELARIPTRIAFGKYGAKNGEPGMLITEMRRIDPGYVYWLLNNHDGVKEDPYMIKALTQ